MNREAGDLKRFRAHYDITVMMNVKPGCVALFDADMTDNGSYIYIWSAARFHEIKSVNFDDATCLVDCRSKSMVADKNIGENKSVLRSLLTVSPPLGHVMAS